MQPNSIVSIYIQLNFSLVTTIFFIQSGLMLTVSLLESCLVDREDERKWTLKYFIYGTINYMAC